MPFSKYSVPLRARRHAIDFLAAFGAQLRGYNAIGDLTDSVQGEAEDLQR
jgi:hypothetical protein